jgi:hypothetical protein
MTREEYATAPTEDETGNTPTTKGNKTDAGNGSKAICRVINVLRSPSPDPRRSADEK